MLKISILLIFYIYLYNTILTIFAFKYKPNHIKEKENINKFIILIPCHNEGEVIYNTLSELYKTK